MNVAPSTTIQPTIQQYITEIENKPLVVITGTNNSGKSYILKRLAQSLGTSAFFMPCQRFFSTRILNTRQINTAESSQWYQSFMQNHIQSDQNNENAVNNLEQTISRLTDAKRDKLFEIVGKLLGSTIQLKKIDESNIMTSFYIDIDDYNIAYSSTGTRILLYLFATMLNEDFKVYLVDEPELGLTPKIQGVLMNYFENTFRSEPEFSHIEKLIISTHSHIFLTKIVTDNYYLDREQNILNIKQVQNLQQLHQLKFNLLGNTFESFELPSIFVVVEGTSDFNYIKKVLNVKFPHNKIVVVNALNDSEIKNQVHQLDVLLGGISNSPYLKKIFVVFDKTHSKSTIDDLTNRMGLNGEDNVTVWDKNGIEFYYPIEILNQLYSTTIGETDIGTKILIEDDNVSCNSRTYRKIELSKLVADNITSATIYNTEFDKFLSKIQTQLS